MFEFFVFDVTETSLGDGAPLVWNCKDYNEAILFSQNWDGFYVVINSNSEIVAANF